ncbi:MAG: hypothetical protein RLZZ341_521, partial [Pseudomonadota bacterium]
MSALPQAQPQDPEADSGVAAEANAPVPGRKRPK